MRELVFALEFQGNGRAGAGRGESASGQDVRDQALHTALKADGVQAGIDRSGANTATFESEVEIVAEGEFLESGSIAYGAAGKVTFKTVGRGMLGPSPMPGVQQGAVIWEITGGDGRFRGAQGLITSNFTVGPAGEVTDDHFARLYLPS